MERDFDGRIGGHRFPVLGARVELPGLHRLDGFLVKTESNASGNFDITRNTVCANDQAENDCPLIFGFTRLFRVLGIGIVDRLGGADTATDSENAAADATATAFADSGPGANTNSATAAGTN